MSQKRANHVIVRVNYRFGSTKTALHLETRPIKNDGTFGELLTMPRERVLQFLKTPNNRIFVNALGNEVRIVVVDGCEYIRMDELPAPEDELGDIPQF